MTVCFNPDKIKAIWGKVDLFFQNGMVVLQIPYTLNVEDIEPYEIPVED